MASDNIASIERGAEALDSYLAHKRAQVIPIHQLTSNSALVDSEADMAKLCSPISIFDSDGRKKPQTTVLIELCERIALFHDADSNSYAIIDEAGHQEIWPIQSRSFHNWLGHQYYKLTGQGVRRQNLVDALATIEAKAKYEAPLHEVFMRVAWLNDRIYIDLADDQWRVVEIDACGWRLLERSPVMFVRHAGMAALPAPIPGNLADIAYLINVAQEDIPLVIGWMLMAARGCGPYPILVVNGEQGTGKSTLTRVIRSLIDPSTVPLRGLSKDIRDLLVTATNNHIVVLDNLSGLTPEVSDALCRFATGGGFAERQLYTNREEVIVNIQRPIILNGIDEIATRADLMERSIVLHLPVIPDTERTDEAARWRRFEELRPGLLGGLCAALSWALRELPNTALDRKPRMADFALWVTAAERAFGWRQGMFMDAYRQNQESGTNIALEASPFGDALVRFMDGRLGWSGTATDLLNELNCSADVWATRSQSWPKSGKGVSNVLHRLAPLLRQFGISVSFGRRTGTDGRRMLDIRKAAK